MNQVTTDNNDDSIPEVLEFRKRRFHLLPQFILGVVGLVAAPIVVQTDLREITFTVLRRNSITDLQDPAYLLLPPPPPRRTGEYQLTLKIFPNEIMFWQGTDKTIILIAQALPWLLAAFGGTAGWAVGSQLQRWEASWASEM